MMLIMGRTMMTVGGGGAAAPADDDDKDDHDVCNDDFPAGLIIVTATAMLHVWCLSMMHVEVSPRRVLVASSCACHPRIHPLRVSTCCRAGARSRGLSPGEDVGVLIAGDFNAEPDSAAVQLLATGSVSGAHVEFAEGVAFADIDHHNEAAREVRPHSSIRTPVDLPELSWCPRLPTTDHALRRSYGIR